MPDARTAFFHSLNQQVGAIFTSDEIDSASVRQEILGVGIAFESAKVVGQFGGTAILKKRDERHRRKSALNRGVYESRPEYTTETRIEVAI